MFPTLLILIGLAVLAFGKRLSVLGAAVGAILGVGLLHLFPGAAEPWLQILAVGVLAVLGFLFAGFAKGIVDIVILVLSALAGAAIVLGFLDLFNLNLGLLDWLLAAAGGVVAVVAVRRFRKGTQDWGLIVLAGLIGALLVTRGLADWIPVLRGPLGTLLVIVLAGGSIAYQGGLLARRGTAADVPTPTPVSTSADAPAVKENASAPPGTK